MVSQQGLEKEEDGGVSDSRQMSFLDSIVPVISKITHSVFFFFYESTVFMVFVKVIFVFNCLP